MEKIMNKLYTSFALIVIFTTSFINVHSQDKVASLNEALRIYKTAEKAFSENKHDKAISLFSQVENFLNNKPQYKKYFDHHYRDFSIIEIVKKHRKISKAIPEITHHITAIFINRTNAEINGKQLNAQLNSKDYESANISMQITKKYLEVATKGQVTIKYKVINIDSSVTQIEPISKHDKRQTPEILINSIKPYPSKQINKLSKTTDTFIFYWKHSSDDGKIKYTGSHGWGGASTIPIIPYSVDTPLRGRILISSGLISRPGTLFHELFHTIEKIYGIKPIHGFRNTERKYFPDWKGKGEFDYYFFQINNILSNNSLNKFRITQTYNFNSEYKFKTSLLNNYNKLTKFSQNKSLEKHFEAVNSKKSKQYVKNKYLEALKFNPNFSHALFKVGTQYYFEKKYKQAEKYINKAYLINPNDPEICYMYGVIKNRNNDIENSIKAMSESININPYLAKAYQYRGYLYFRSNAFKESELDFIKAVKLDKNLKKWVTNYLGNKSKSGDRNAENILKQIQ